MKVLTTLRAIGVSTVLAGSLMVGLTSAAPSQVYVSKTNCLNSGPGTKQKPFCTVQQGINAASNGDAVNVGPGTYSEQVTITGKNDLTVTGTGGATIIQMPTATTAGGAIVAVSNSQNLELTRLTVNGPFNINSCTPQEYGIQLNNRVSATIDYVNVTNIRPASDGFFGCQAGLGIVVGRQSAGAVATATIDHTNVSGYAKEGILVDNNGSNANISQSTITGRGPTSLTALNGIQIGRGATATLTQNTVTGNEYTGDGGATTATGILIFSTSNITARQNTVNKNDVGFDIDATNSSFTQNTASNNTTNGFYVESTSSHDTFSQNTAKGNSGSEAYIPFDLQDTSTGSGSFGTANFWSQNNCKTGSPAGICKE